MAEALQSFLGILTSRHRVIVIGGVAVIAHGRNRHTKDADLWLEPMDSSEIWANALESVLIDFPGATIHRIPRWTEVRGAEIANAIDEVGMVRIHGLGQPVDVFRKPNELEHDAFDDIASRCHINSDGTLLIHPLDLIITKFFTDRKSDHEDIAFLEAVARDEYLLKLPSATYEEAEFMLGRYAEWQVLEAALINPSPEVQELATGMLKEFAEAGDPFSKDILEGRKTPDRP